MNTTLAEPKPDESRTTGNSSEADTDVPPPPLVTLPDILAARARLQGAIRRTPCPFSPGLSDLTGARIFCKQEFLQHTGSFKERGARNTLAQLTPAEARRGVIAASAGNHALGVAWHGKQFGVPVTVVMPRSAPRVKADRCRRLGATVRIHGSTFDEARAEADQLAARHHLVPVHPFHDPRVIAGQGTLALELLEQVPHADAVLVPIGGGGLFTGLLTALRVLQPRLQVIGVEPAHAPCFSAGLAAGYPIRVPTRTTLADGLAVAEASRNTLALALARTWPYTSPHVPAVV